MWRAWIFKGWSIRNTHFLRVFWAYRIISTLSDKVVLIFGVQRDIGKVVEALYGENPPPIMIIGHSMGGAIAVHTANANHIPSLLGLCVIDVVEGKHTLLK